MNKIDMEELKKILYVDEDLYNQYGKRNEDGLWIFFDEYADEKIEKKLCEKVANIDNPNTLYVLASNYNYGDGYKIPMAIINNKNCYLSTALNIFYLAAGDELLQNRSEFLAYDRKYFGEQIDFLLILEQMILENKFETGNIGYCSYINPRYLKNVDTRVREAFYVDIDGEDLDGIRV